MKVMGFLGFSTYIYMYIYIYSKDESIRPRIFFSNFGCSRVSCFFEEGSSEVNITTPRGCRASKWLLQLYFGRTSEGR